MTALFLGVRSCIKEPKPKDRWRLTKVRYVTRCWCCTAQPVHLTPYSDLKMLTLNPAAKPHITYRRSPSVKANKTISFTKSNGATVWFKSQTTKTSPENVEDLVPRTWTQLSLCFTRIWCLPVIYPQNISLLQVYKTVTVSNIKLKCVLW